MIKGKRLISWAILVMEFNSLAMSAVSLALENIGAIFPEVPHAFLSMLSTLPALICVPVGVLSTSLVGRRITFRNMSVLGAILLALGGLGPMFAETFPALLFWRLVFGIGMGVMSPMGGALMFSCLNKAEAEVQSSADAISNSVGAIVYQLMGGYLCSAFSWRNTFLVYLLILPTMGFVLCALSRIKIANTCFIEKKAQQKRAAGKQHYGIDFWLWCSLYGVFCILFYPLVTDMSTLVLNNGYGTAASVSLILSIYTVGGAFGGYLYHFKPILDLDSKVFALIFSLNAVGFLIIIFADGVPLLLIGSLIFGVGYGLFTAAITIFAGYSVPKELRMGVMARILVFTGIGEFVSAFVLAFLKNRIFHSSNDRFSYIFSFVCLVILAVVFAIKPKGKEMEEDIVRQMEAL